MAAFVTCSRISRSTVNSRDKRGRWVTRRPQLAMETNRRKSSVRSKVEHPFLILKRLWSFAKVRYRGLAKNANRAFAMLAMLNISKWGSPPLPGMKKTIYSMKIQFASQLRLDLYLPPRFATSCSTFP